MNEFSRAQIPSYGKLLNVKSRRLAARLPEKSGEIEGKGR